MSLIWKYLDKITATIAAIKDYASMRFIIEHTDEKIRNEQDNMKGLRSPSFDGMPHAHNPQAAEDRIVDSLEEIDVLKERYRQACEYMDWFVPAWKALSDDEKYILETFYGENNYGDYAVDQIADKFSIERSSAYRKKNRAVDHLTVLLFGKE